MLTQARLKELLCYDPDTGVFHWRIKKTNSVRAGERAGHFSPINGYHHIRIDWRLYRAHRLAWLYVHGAFPDLEVDHINGVRSDNRMQNLRIATGAQNRRNSGIRSDSTSRVKGVSFSKHRQKWIAQITHSGKHHSLGGFSTIEEAAAAYAEAARRLHQEFARLG